MPVKWFLYHVPHIASESSHYVMKRVYFDKVKAS